MQLVKNIFAALAAGLGFAQRRQELVNSPEMQANAAAKRDAAVAKAATEAVAKGDLDEIRRMAGE